MRQNMAEQIEMDLVVLLVLRVLPDVTHVRRDSPGASISFSLPSAASGQHFVQLLSLLRCSRCAYTPCTTCTTFTMFAMFDTCLRMDYVSPWIFGEADETEL